MKFRMTDVALGVGLGVIFSPWIFGFSPNWVWYWMAVVALILVAIAGYDAQANILGLGNPGEDYLRRFALKFKKFLKNVCSRF